MAFQDFLPIYYSAIFILSALLSVIPAYLARRQGKNFWSWWIGTTFSFWVLLYFLVRLQAFSYISYSLIVLPVISMLALLPKSDRFNFDFSFRGKLNPRDGWLFLLALFIILLVSGVFYHFLVSGGSLNPIFWLPRYYVVKRVVFFIAALGYATFLYTISEKRIRYIAFDIGLVGLLSAPFFQKPDRAFIILKITDLFTQKSVVLDVLIMDLIKSPAIGIFILLGVCAGCAALVVVLNDRFGITDKVLPVLIGILHIVLSSVAFLLPSMRLTKSRFVSSYILAGVFLLRFASPLLRTSNDATIRNFLSFILICSPILGFGLFVIVVVKSIQQRKLLILIVFLIVSLKGITTPTVLLFIVAPFISLDFFGNAFGFVSLIIWVVSDSIELDHDSNRIDKMDVVSK